LLRFLEQAKSTEPDEHGKALSTEYLEYARQDVATTWDCFVKLRERYEARALNTPINRIFSETSIEKAYFDKMGIKPLAITSAGCA
jgi:hypothetical protein